VASESHGAEVAEHGHSPLEQFVVRPIIEIQAGTADLSFTNSSLFMAITVAVVTLLMVVGMRRRAMVPGRLQSVAELSYGFISDMIRDNVGPRGRAYFPFVFTMFMFILFGNLLGMIPYSFTFTSHIVVTFVLALVVFVGVTIIGFAASGPKFLRLFVPAGAPIFLLPLLIVIEIISYFVRPISLSLRLFANMMAGHTMLKVFGGFVLVVGAAGALPILITVALTGLEVVVAILQAYVFTILSCLYLNDAFHPGH